MTRMPQVPLQHQTQLAQCGRDRRAKKDFLKMLVICSLFLKTFLLLFGQSQHLKERGAEAPHSLLCTTMARKGGQESPSQEV
jgi:hypothetical protein